MSDERKVEVVYDRECPVCNFHARNLELDDRTNELHLVNARNDSALMREVSAAGLDIDEGMVVKTGDKLYFGSDAMHKLAALNTGRGFSNSVLRLLFRNERLAAALYPLLASLRRLLLRLLGRSKINNLGTGNNSNNQG